MMLFHRHLNFHSRPVFHKAYNAAYNKRREILTYTKAVRKASTTSANSANTTGEPRNNIVKADTMPLTAVETAAAATRSLSNDVKDASHSRKRS